jgi:hypothetical protein
MMAESNDLFPRKSMASKDVCTTDPHCPGEKTSCGHQNNRVESSSLPSEELTAQQREKLRKRLQLEKLERELETRERRKEAPISRELQVEKTNSSFHMPNDSTSSKGKLPWTVPNEDSQPDGFTIRQLPNIERDDWDKKRKELGKGLRKLRTVFHDEKNINQSACNTQEQSEDRRKGSSAGIFSPLDMTEKLQLPQVQMKFDKRVPDRERENELQKRNECLQDIRKVKPDNYLPDIVKRNLASKPQQIKTNPLSRAAWISSGVSEAQPTYHSLTIIVVPDILIDPKCYNIFEDLPKRLGEDIKLITLSLATYSATDSTPSKTVGFTDDVQRVRDALRTELDSLNRDVIFVGHGYGALIASSACRGMIRVPREGVSGHSRRVASVQGIVAIAGWVLTKDQSIILAGPKSILNFRLNKVRSF